MGLRPQPFMPGKQVHPAPGIPQNVLPPPQVQQNMKPVIPRPSTLSVKQVPLQSTKGQAREPNPPKAQDDQVNYCEDAIASEGTGPVFSVNCGMTEHSASQHQNTAIREDLAYSLWAEQRQTSHTTSDNEMVLTLPPAEAAHIDIATPLTITCGKVQLQTNPEPFTSGRTIMSNRLLLAIESKQRPDLTLDALSHEIVAEKLQCRPLTIPHLRNGK